MGNGKQKWETEMGNGSKLCCRCKLWSLCVPRCPLNKKGVVLTVTGSTAGTGNDLSSFWTQFAKYTQTVASYCTSLWHKGVLLKGRLHCSPVVATPVYCSDCSHDNAYVVQRRYIHHGIVQPARSEHVLSCSKGMVHPLQLCMYMCTCLQHRALTTTALSSQSCIARPLSPLHLGIWQCKPTLQPYAFYTNSKMCHSACTRMQNNAPIPWSTILYDCVFISPETIVLLQYVHMQQCFVCVSVHVCVSVYMHAYLGSQLLGLRMHHYAWLLALAYEIALHHPQGSRTSTASSFRTYSLSAPLHQSMAPAPFGHWLNMTAG